MEWIASVSVVDVTTKIQVNNLDGSFGYYKNGESHTIRTLVSSAEKKDLEVLVPLLENLPFVETAKVFIKKGHKGREHQNVFITYTNGETHTVSINFLNP